MHIKHRWSARTAAGLVLFLAAACAWSAPRAHSWRLVDLGTLGGSGSFATAVSDNGFVAGCSNTPSGDVHAFLYRNGRMVDLAGDEAGNSCALAVNGRGEAAGRNGSGEQAAPRATSLNHKARAERQPAHAEA
jgi:probable HAF family extracellular repeat protein